ncbi:MAG TPA: ABC transporter ATP-binding protein [Devosiaceae bacterium]|jgi:oligopeptide/dipeptide ABC transporter ATP-binding protein|nr:ABC transporter ATP-binding protein [Devosiaceae bacterium]
MAEALSVDGLTISFPGRSGPIKVVDDVSLSLEAGQSLVIAGESGSGKSMVCQALLGIVPKAASVTGRHILWRDRDLLRADERQWRTIRGAEIAMIFQDPTAALNPLITVEHQILDVIRDHRRCSREEARARTVEVLGMAGFPDAARRMKSYPSELSGGLRQRVAIALALACSPSLIIADEATTNLDVSIQAQIVELLRRLKDELGLALIFVTHDLGLAAEIGGDLLVMYAGKAVERGPVRTVLDDPCHPYTRGLLRSAPTLSSSRANPLRPIPGQAPRPGTLGDAAPFSTRCPVAVAGLCERVSPGWTPAGPGHEVACHRFAQDGRGGLP